MTIFTINAQKIEITPQYGYQIGAKFSYYGGYIKLTDSDQYGITLGAPISDDIQVEFMWAQQNAAVKVYDVIHYPRETEITDITVNHYQLGVVHTFGYSDAVPFFGLLHAYNNDIASEITTSALQFSFSKIL